MQLTIKKHRPGKNQYAVHKATFKNLLFRNNLQAEENVLWQLKKNIVNQVQKILLIAQQLVQISQ